MFDCQLVIDLEIVIYVIHTIFYVYFKVRRNENICSKDDLIFLI